MAAAIVVEGRRLARSGKAFSGNGEAGELNLWRPPALGTISGASDIGCGSGEFCAVLRMGGRKIPFTSTVASVFRRGVPPTPKKIISPPTSPFLKNLPPPSLLP